MPKKYYYSYLIYIRTRTLFEKHFFSYYEKGKRKQSKTNCEGQKKKAFLKNKTRPITETNLSINKFIITYRDYSTDYYIHGL